MWARPTTFDFHWYEYVTGAPPRWFGPGGATTALAPLPRRLSSLPEHVAGNLTSSVVVMELAEIIGAMSRRRVPICSKESRAGPVDTPTPPPGLDLHRCPTPAIRSPAGARRAAGASRKQLGDPLRLREAHRMTRHELDDIIGSRREHLALELDRQRLILGAHDVRRRDLAPRSHRNRFVERRRQLGRRRAIARSRVSSSQSR